MVNKADFITSQQLVYIIVGAQVGIGIFSLPRVAAAGARQDAWMAVLIGALVPLLVLIIIQRLGRRMPKSSFVTMNQQLFGPWVGTIMVFLFVFYVIFFESTVIRLFSEITSIFLLPQTPLVVIVLTIVLAVAYIINKGAVVVARLNVIFFWIVLSAAFLGLATLVHADYTNLLPVGEVGLEALTRSSLATGNAYAGMEVLLVFYFLVREKNEVLKAGIKGLGITMIFYLEAVLISIMVLGVELLDMINWPVLTLFKTVNFGVLERPELIVLTIWLMVGIRPIMNLGFAAAHSLSEVLQVNRDKYFHWVVLAISLAMLIMAILPKNLIIALEWAEYTGYAFLVVGLFYPLLMLTVAMIRRKEA